MGYRFTVFTPTYNRAHLLPRLYASLCRQTIADFEWLVVDDGSTDDTKEVVQGFIDEGKLTIRYIWQPNGGKLRAVNRGSAEAKGLLMMIADSDDWLPDHSLQTAWKYYEQIKGNPEFGGVCGLDEYEDGGIIGSRLPQPVIDERYHRLDCVLPQKGDMKEVILSSVMREFPFPDIEGEKFCAESLFLNRISRKYKFRYFNEPIYTVEYQADGYSNDNVRLRMKNPVYATTIYSEMLGMDLPFKSKLKAALNYWRFRLCSDDRRCPQVPLQWRLLKPVGWLLHRRDCRLPEKGKPVRLLHVITSLHTGGAEKLMVDLLPRLAAKGYCVELAVFDGTQTPFMELVEKSGVRVHRFSRSGSVYNPLHLLKLARLVGRFDIVHAHNASPQLFTAIAGVMNRRVLLCTTEHTTSNRRRRLAWYRPIDRWMYRQYDAVMSISDGAAENMRSQIAVKQPIAVVNNGIDVDANANAEPLSRSELGCREDSFVLAMVASFRIQKDQKTVVRAICLLPEDTELVLAGTGPMIDELRAYVRERGLDRRVHFLGVRPDVPRILKTVDVVVMSSNWEGFGLAAAEGMAAGKPVVASDVPGLADVVRDAGLLFPKGDEKALAMLLQRLHDDEAFRAEVATLCARRAKRYDISLMVEGYDNIYKELMERK